jgi:lipoate-protein ligase A
MIEIYFNVKKGIISSLDIYGDFFALKDLTPFKSKLLNQPYNREVLGKIIDETEDFNQYFFNLDKKDFVNLILEENK